ncbi:MAG: hypothetical protein P1V20_19385 [Verrucomicrobiales bacterium]|nr:hypothetical protein [Verrucomicrobiales bacterium]
MNDNERLADNWDFIREKLRSKYDHIDEGEVVFPTKYDEEWFDEFATRLGKTREDLWQDMNLSFDEVPATPSAGES